MNLRLIRHALALFAVGFAPMGVAFGGANTWVTNIGNYTVTEL